MIFAQSRWDSCAAPCAASSSAAAKVVVAEVDRADEHRRPGRGRRSRSRERRDSTTFVMTSRRARRAGEACSVAVQTRMRS